MHHLRRKMNTDNAGERGWTLLHKTNLLLLWPIKTSVCCQNQPWQMLLNRMVFGNFHKQLMSPSFKAVFWDKNSNFSTITYLSKLVVFTCESVLFQFWYMYYMNSIIVVNHFAALCRIIMTPFFICFLTELTIILLLPSFNDVWSITATLAHKTWITLISQQKSEPVWRTILQPWGYTKQWARWR